MLGNLLDLGGVGYGRWKHVHDLSSSLFQGWYIVTYALGIYHLNLFIAFLSPKVDPSLMEDSGRVRAHYVVWREK